MDLISRPTIDRYIARLRLRKSVSLPFEHGGVLRGLLSWVLARHRLPPGLVPFPSESGRVRFLPGDAYQFGITLIGEARSLAGPIEEGLRRRGVARGSSPLPVLGGNFVVEGLTQIEPPDLDQDASVLDDEVEMILCSPLRLERPPDLKARGAGYLNGDCFPADWFLDRVWRRCFFVAHGRHAEADDRRLMPPMPRKLAATPGSLQWVDLPVRGTEDKGRPYTLGGVRGSVRLSGLDETWREVLALGSHLHVGQKAQFGLGRIALSGTAALDPTTPCGGFLRPSRSLLSVASSQERLGCALAQALQDEEPHEVPDLARLSCALAGGRYQPSPLVGSTPQTVVADRVAQRAVMEVLSPALDTFLEDSSAAYHLGLSRQGAARAIERAWDDGFRYVLDADLRSLFELVDWSRVLGRVRSLYPLDPVVELIERWARSPVGSDAFAVECHGDLPRRVPLSPILTKLSLDAVHDALEDAGLRLVRWGDEFVVLARDLEAARSVRDSSIDEGAVGSWLASVPFERLQELVEEGRDDRGQRIIKKVPLRAEPQVVETLPRPLYISSPDAQIQLRRRTIITMPAGGEETTIPIEGVSHLVLCGRTGAKLSVLQRLARRGVPTFFCRASGEPYATLDPHDDRGWDLWLDQARLAADEEACRAFAVQVVSARLHNAATLMVQLDWHDATTVAEEIRELAKACENKTTMDALRGLEGRGAALYWQSLASTLPEIWQFTGRARRPPPDPVNAMLSFGYTLLHHHVSTSLVAAGLNPRIGLFHQPRGAHHALASDLTEELRYLVEALVWSLIRRRQMHPDRDFRPSPDGRYPALLTPEARHAFIDAFERRLITTFTPPGEEESMTYRAFIARQAHQVEALAAGRQTVYRPLVLTA